MNSISASLPFITSKHNQLFIAIIVGIVTSICWAFISRSVPQSEIPLYGLLYDAMLTLIFLIIPFFFIKFELNKTKVFGIVLVLIGLFLTKK